MRWYDKGDVRGDAELIARSHEPPKAKKAQNVKRAVAIVRSW